ncbi:hypothetical protein IGI04_013023 [Brassica rapa subsp. trilocularis]|uniref:Uncharacterized protein n=1 Tax=Brassica rapa subsp. trilocularis TaxID=1813537 RepID=A0ABQ7NAV5_BRACM|nr:hypothetical protein IGI04_013023 [Brassica rapa subsp. trilocularis]
MSSRNKWTSKGKDKGDDDKLKHLSYVNEKLPQDTLLVLAEVQEAEHDPQVCIDFALVYRVFMFAADCATYGGVWGGQGGWLGRI